MIGCAVWNAWLQGADGLTLGAAAVAQDGVYERHVSLQYPLRPQRALVLRDSVRAEVLVSGRGVCARGGAVVGV